MDDRRNLFVIIFLTFFVMMYVQVMFPQPAPAPQQSQQQTTTSGATPPTIEVTPGQSVPVAVSSAQGQLSRPSAEQLKESPQTVVDTGVALITINHLGGRIQSVKLKEYKQNVHDTNPFEMIVTKDGAPLPLGVTADGTNDDFVLYQIDSKATPTPDGPIYKADVNGLTISLIGELTTGTKIKKLITFKPKSYDAEVAIELSQASRDGAPVSLEWTKVVPPEKHDVLAHSQAITFLNVDNKLTNTFIAEIKGTSKDLGLGHWVGICDYYFVETILAPGGKGFARVDHVNDTYAVRISGSAAGGVFKIYTGPKEIETLRAVGSQLERSIDLGMFSFLAHPILSLMKFFYKFLGNYGLSIILLTLLIKLAFLPLTQSSFKSMQAMQELQPEIKALRERVEDPNVLNQELMALYKKRGVNPLGGCLPILIQIPVFLGLYNALLNSTDLRHAPFALWINDLSSPEKLELFGIGIPLMILIMGASMFIQQWTQPSAMDPQQKKIMMLMPVIFTAMFIIHPMPSGLVLYWLVNNLISIVQQAAIKGDRKMTPLKATSYASLAMFCFGYVLTLI